MAATLTYIGHSAFQLSDGAKTILIDPFVTGNPVATISADSLSPDAILITHAHNDHVGDAIEIAKRVDCPVVTTVELSHLISSKGVKQVQGGNFGGTLSFPGGTAKIVPAWHSSTYHDGENAMAQGIPAGLVVRFGSATIYFAGDTCLFGDMALIGDEELDAAVLPIGDFFTMGPADAVKAAKLLRAPVIVPCHYNTFPPIKQDGAAFKAKLESETSAKAAILKPGEQVQIGA
jgi:L-ascorbate metabolism protein UlaG (beta-lactamase superfamily)